MNFGYNTYMKKMGKLFLSILAVFLFASCTVAGGVLFTGCSQSESVKTEQGETETPETPEGAEDAPSGEENPSESGDEESDDETEAQVTYYYPYFGGSRLSSTSNPQNYDSLNGGPGVNYWSSQNNQGSSAPIVTLKVGSTTLKTSTQFSGQSYDVTYTTSTSRTFTLSYTAKTGYTFLGWWIYSWNDDGADGGESSFSKVSTNSTYTYRTTGHTGIRYGSGYCAMFYKKQISTEPIYTLRYSATGGTVDGKGAISTSIFAGDYYGKTNIYGPYNPSGSGLALLDSMAYRFSTTNSGSGGKFYNFFYGDGFGGIIAPDTKYTVVYECLRYSGYGGFNVTLVSPDDVSGDSDISATGNAMVTFSGTGVQMSTFTTKSDIYDSDIRHTFRSYIHVLPYANLSAQVRISLFLGDIVFDEDDFTYTQHYAPSKNPLPTPLRSGYTFAGWYTASSGGTQVTSSTRYTTSGNSTVYAHWSINQYDVTLSKGTGISSVSGGGTYDYGARVSIRATASSGYTFSKWSITSGSATIASTTSSSTTLTVGASDVTVSALAEANSYTVTFNANGGSVSTSSKTVSYNSTYGTLPTPTRSNYVFVGWYTSASGGSLRTSSSTYTTAGDSTLYAHWGYKSVTVYVRLRYINEDGTGGTTNSSLGGSVSGTYYSLSSAISGYSSAYSTRTRVSYTQSSSSTSRTHHSGSAFTIRATPNPGYVFAGFSTSSTPSTSIKNPSSSVSTSHTYYPTSSTNYYYVYFKKVSTNELKYDDTFGYFYFEDGEYPQSYAGTYSSMSSSLTSMGNSIRYVNASGSSATIPIYQNSSGTRYAVVTAPTSCTITLTDLDGSTQNVSFTASTQYCFEFEPIRWRVTDYGLDEDEVPSEWDPYTAYNEGFVAVSDLILGASAMHTTRNVNEGTSVSSLTAYSNTSALTASLFDLSYYSSDSIDLDRYNPASSGNAVSSANSTYSSPIRIVSNSDLESVGLVNYQARASHMVAMLLGMDDTRCTYWTRNLSKLGSGVAITASGADTRPWLTEFYGVRYAYTFSAGSNLDY